MKRGKAIGKQMIQKGREPAEEKTVYMEITGGKK
jgi:hypothetical protein